MFTRIFQLLLLSICFLQFLSLPALDSASKKFGNDSAFILEESGETESVEEVCHWICHLESLDCQHDQIVGDVFILGHLPDAQLPKSCVHLRGPPSQA